MNRFGFGAMRLPLINPDDKQSIDMDELKRMVDIYMEAGFTYFDTAFPYHDQMSETALKEALVDRYDRDKYVFADKMPTVLIKSGEEYPLYFNKQLEKTGVGYFDYYLMHNMGRDRYYNTDKWGGFEFAKKMKAEGKIKNFGFSFHDDAQFLDMILTNHPEVDFVQLQINYLDWENDIIQSRLCYETARRHNKPIAVMESVKGGTLANLPKEAENILREYNKEASPASYALRFAANLDGVFMVLSGMSNCEQVLDNTKIMARPQPLNDKEKELLKEVVIEKHFRAIAPKSVKVVVKSLHGGMPYVAPTDMPAYKAAEKAVEATFGKKPLPFYSGGSIPIISGFESILGIKSLLIGFGLAEDAIHSPNESYGLEQFDKGVETIPLFYKYFAESE